MSQACSAPWIALSFSLGVFSFLGLAALLYLGAVTLDKKGQLPPRQSLPEIELKARREATFLVLVAGCGGSSTEASPKIDADQVGTLLVQTAGRATLSETRPWLEETSPQTAWRASDCESGAGMISTESFVSLWEQEEIFTARTT